MGGAASGLGGALGGGLGGKGAASGQEDFSGQVFGSLNTPVASFGAGGGRLARPIESRSRAAFTAQERDSRRAGQIADLESSAVQAARLQAGAGQRFGNFSEQAEIERLRAIARPEEDRLRASLLSRSANSGRLGVGVGGGLTGGFFNPEIAAQEEAFARADLARVQAARGEEQRLLGNLTGAIGLSAGINAQAFNQNAGAFANRINTVNSAILPLAQVGGGAAFGGLQNAANIRGSNQAAGGAAFGQALGGGLGALLGGGGGSLGGLFGGGATGGGGGFDFDLAAGSGGGGFFGSGFDSVGGI